MILSLETQWPFFLWKLWCGVKLNTKILMLRNNGTETQNPESSSIPDQNHRFQPN
jgi:hypothetical protein